MNYKLVIRNCISRVNKTKKSVSCILKWILKKIIPTLDVKKTAPIKLDFVIDCIAIARRGIQDSFVKLEPVLTVVR